MTIIIGDDSASVVVRLMSELFDDYYRATMIHNVCWCLTSLGWLRRALNGAKEFLWLSADSFYR